MLPLGGLFPDPGQEPGAAGPGEAGRSHELEAGLCRCRFLVRIDETEHCGGRAGEAQLVGEKVADQPRAFPRGPT